MQRNSLLKPEHDALSILSGAHKPELLREETLVSLFKAGAAEHGKKTALMFHGDTLTYQELDAWSDQCAGLLQKHHCAEGESVCVYLPRSLDLHAAVLGIVKAGGCYVPIDRETPVDRVQQIAEESGARIIITDATLEKKLIVLTLSNLRNNSGDVPLPALHPDSRAYIIYTSGSTGKPKGIPITHRMICHLLRAEQDVLRIQNTDRVYQGFSVSFDMWCEEVWLSYLVGACLIVADSLTAKSIDELPDFWNENAITVLHAVPSLLALLDGEQTPRIRLINTGGEACTPQVVKKWWSPTRRIINSYGPTEATVSATMAELGPDQPITLGKPLANYGLAVVDESMNPVPYDTPGELVITGVGVSMGYIDRPELTAEKFLPLPYNLAMLPGERMYRTGDRARITSAGEIRFEGRIDNQVKLRGHRIELGEVENVLLQLPAIRSAVVVIVGRFEHSQLVAGVELHAGHEADVAQWKTHMASSLPSYMVPVDFITLDKLPRLTSGKLDANAVRTLFQPSVTQAPTTEEYTSTQPVVERLKTALKAVFPGREIDLDKDFFTHLGGHSLLAASLVSRLRSRGHLPKAALRDVYLHRPLKKLAEQWEKNSETKTENQASFHAANPLHVGLCTLAQSAALFLLFGVFSLQIFLPYLAYYSTQQLYHNQAASIATALLSFLLLPPSFTLLTIACKRLIGPFKEGVYPVWGLTYFRYWLMERVLELSPMQFFNDTPYYSWYAQLLGMQVGAHTHLGKITFGIPELITIGNHVTLSADVVLDNATIEQGFLKLRPIVIDDYAHVGSASVVCGGAQMGRFSELGDLSCLNSDQAIPPAEIWRGSPAKFQRQKTPLEMRSPSLPSRHRVNACMTAYAVLILALPLVVLLPALPAILVLNAMAAHASVYDFLSVIPVLVALYVGLFICITITMTRGLVGRIPAGNYPLYSSVYVRKWLVDQVHNMALFVLHPLFASIFARSYFRALGADIGRNTEISTASNVTPHLLKMGSDSFIADAVMLGESEIRGQEFILKHTTIGQRTFIGNSAVIPQGSHVPDQLLLGVLSLAPTPEEYQPDIATYLGSPALPFPRREACTAFNNNLTFTPPLSRRLARGSIELMRILLPSLVTISCSALFINVARSLLTEHNGLQLAYQLPLYYLAFIGAPSFLSVVALKWLLIGRYRPQQHPMWTLPVWLSEAVTTSYEGLAVPFLLHTLKGTLWLPICLKILGVKIGRRVVLNSTDFTEFDCITIGDDAVLNTDSGPQTHLFEDRIMKIGTVTMGARCSIGARGVVLYDSTIGEDTTLEPLSLVMKGETLPPNSCWHGSPVEPKISTAKAVAASTTKKAQANITLKKHLPVSQPSRNKTGILFFGGSEITREETRT